MPSVSYLPSRQALLLAWSTNFNSKLMASAEAAAEYGLTTVQASAYSAKHIAFEEAYNVATDRITRSPANIEKKDTAKKALINEARKLVDICQAWPEMTNDKRSELGITLRDNEPTPTPIPTSAPEVTVASVSGRLFNLQLREVGSERRAKPKGVRAAWLYTCICEDMPTVFDEFKFRGEVRKTDTQLVMPASVVAGTKIWISACWVNTAGKPGPASLPVATWTTHGTMNVAA